MIYHGILEKSEVLEEHTFTVIEKELIDYYRDTNNWDSFVLEDELAHSHQKQKPRKVPCV